MQGCVASAGCPPPPNKNSGYAGVSKRIESGLDIDVISLDFQTAFDKVSHKCLLLNVEKAGIQGPISFL